MLLWCCPAVLAASWLGVGWQREPGGWWVRALPHSIVDSTLAVFSRLCSGHSCPEAGPGPGEGSFVPSHQPPRPCPCQAAGSSTPFLSPPVALG